MFTAHKQPQFVVFSLLIFLILLTSTSYADPRVGPVTPTNSIIGANPNDQIGSGGVYALPSGNIVIASPNWNNYRGAVTCLTPSEYRRGNIVINAENSLVGNAADNNVGSGRVKVLKNGNYIVLSPSWDNGASVDVGAVTWVNGITCVPAGESTRNAIVGVNNSLIGATGNNEVSNKGVVELANGNYVVVSPKWNGNGIAKVGAVTWGNGSTGITGEISAENSLVGTMANDQIGSNNIAVLANGNYIIKSPLWDNVGISDVGAATWGNGLGGTVGIINSNNSLIGLRANDQVGQYVTVLTNSNYVVGSPYWDDGGTIDVGAVTWGDGDYGVVGLVDVENSMIGSTTGDLIGIGSGTFSSTALSNGHYVIASMYWDNGSIEDAGAITWGNGNGGTVGMVNPANSLVGSTNKDQIGRARALSNGNYMVSASGWDRGAIKNAGAATWGNGNGGTVGPITPMNSLVGATTSDNVGGALILTNGNYVVLSYQWTNPGVAVRAGAATWADGNVGITGEISEVNSLIGSSDNDEVGSSMSTALSNGHYVIHARQWTNGDKTGAGAAAWGNGNGGTVGQISASNALVGTQEYDYVGSGGITALPNGHYLVQSPNWANGSEIAAGAVTWGDGNGGIIGEISAANSLVGSRTGSLVGALHYSPLFISPIVTLTNGHYVVVSPLWSSSTINSVGAVTWGNGNGGTVGEISVVNSLVGKTESDMIGSRGGTGELTSNLTFALPNGDYVVGSSAWSLQELGAVTLGNGNGGTVGEVSAINSLVGATFGDSLGFTIKPLSDGSYLVVGSGWDKGAMPNVGAIIWSDIYSAPPGEVTLSKSAATVTEGDNADSYTVVLGNVPSDDVHVTLTFDDADLQARTNTGEFQGSPLVLTFTENNWLTPQTVEIMALDDGDLEGTENVGITHAVTSADANYNGIIPTPDDEVTVTITDNENLAPLLATIGDRTTYLGKTLNFNVDADDPNLPAQTLTFSLESGAPAGAAIDPVSGQFTWTLDETVTVGAYPITVTVTDDGDPALTDSETFTVTVQAANLISNYGFENVGNNQKLAAGWAAIQLTTNDRRMCDTETKSYAREGACAYRFSISKNTTQKRTIQKAASKAGVVKNDTLELRGWVKATNLTAGARLSLTVTYNNGTTKVVNINLTAGTYDYQLFSKQVTLTRPVKSLRVKIEARGAKGTFFVDDMAVVEVTPESLAVSVPAAPDLRGIE